MARRGSRSGKGRGARSQPMDISGTLGGLLRTTLQQVGVVKEAVERQARSSRMRLDEVMLQRKRRDALARVGELIYELALQGKLGDLEEEVPELAELLADVEDVEEQLGEPFGEEAEVEAVSSADWKPPGRTGSDREPLRVWRPVMPGDQDQDAEPDPGVDAAAAQPVAQSASSGASPARPGARPGRAGRAAQRTRGGGISFVADDVDDDDDHDLAAYMNDEDVPAKE